MSHYFFEIGNICTITPRMLSPRSSLIRPYIRSSLCLDKRNYSNYCVQHHALCSISPRSTRFFRMSQLEPWDNGHWMGFTSGQRKPRMAGELDVIMNSCMFIKLASLRSSESKFSRWSYSTHNATIFRGRDLPEWINSLRKDAVFFDCGWNLNREKKEGFKLGLVKGTN